MSKDVPTEYEEQRDIFLWSNASNKKELKLLHASLNGVRLTIGQSMKAKRSGMKKGVPDLFLPIPRHDYHGLFIELKRAKGGTVSKEQKQWLNDLNEQGYLAVVCKGADEAIKTITDYLK